MPPSLAPDPPEPELWRRYTDALLAADYARAFVHGRAILESGDARAVDGMLDLYAESFQRRGGQGRCSAAWFSGHLRALEAASRSSPSDPWALAYRANLLDWSGRAEEAAAEYARLEREREAPFLLWLAGRWRLRAGLAQAAADDLRRAADAFPRVWRLRCWTAEALLCAGRAEEAFGQFERAARDAHAPDPALAWQGEARLWVGDYDGALVALRAGAASPTAACWTGAALLKLGRLEEAEAALEETVARCPWDAEALVWRAEARLRAGRFAQARADAQTALARSANPWALVLEALSRRACGERAAPARARARLRRRFAGWRRAWGWPADARDAAAALEAKLLAGLGNRRPEPYTALATRRSKRATI